MDVKLSPHYSDRKGHDITHDVIHYTAGGRASGTVRWFQDPRSRVSAHYVIARDGKVTRCVPLSKKAWHAGASWARYHGERKFGVNEFSIGYELANRGRLYQEDGQFYYKFGRDFRKYRGPEPGWGVMREGRRMIRGFWEPYPEVQILALRALLREVDKETGTNRMIVGHNEISPGRKVDPGPLFPWTRFRRHQAAPKDFLG